MGTWREESRHRRRFWGLVTGGLVSKGCSPVISFVEEFLTLRNEGWMKEQLWGDDEFSIRGKLEVVWGDFIIATHIYS